MPDLDYSRGGARRVSLWSGKGSIDRHEAGTVPCFLMQNGILGLQAGVDVKIYCRVMRIRA
jgi:hypothetical protein